jgi:hypothetical protein
MSVGAPPVLLIAAIRPASSKRRRQSMKRQGMITAAAVAACMAVPVAAHHMAEGIVADDLYDAISENLAGTPHEDIDFEVTDDDMGGALTAVVTVTVPADEVDEMEALIDDTMDTVVGDEEVLGAQGEMIEGSISVEYSEPDENGDVTITITEHLGVGESQDDIVDEYGNPML